MTKKKIWISSLVGLIAGLVIENLSDSIGHSVGKPMTILFLSLFLSASLMHFLGARASKIWIRFVYLWLPLSVILSALAPEYDNSLLNLQRDIASMAMGAVLLVISGGIALWKHHELA